MNRAELVLPIPDEELLKACDIEEIGFWSAFQSHYRSAVVLSNAPGLQAESLLAMRFAVECFLKHVVCAARWHHLGRSGLPGGKFFRPELLGHELRLLSTWVQAFVDDSRGSEFKTLSAALPKSPAWIRERYKGGAQAPSNAARDYLRTKTAFDTVLAKFGVPQP